jgi:drug/metabolite transporter (DMT)-like permease
MRTAETASLLAMAALWGGSFVFQRALVPLYGPVPLTFLRLFFAGSFLLLVAWASRRPLPFAKGFWLLLGIGLLTSAVPYTLFAFGAKTLSSALLAVMNATAPMFGAVFSVIWLAERLRPVQIVGLLVGTAGVAVVSEAWTAQVTAEAWTAIVACLLAAACYGLSGVVMKRRGGGLSALDLAIGGQAMGAVALLGPAAATWPAQATFDGRLAVAAVFGVTCSALPFLLYTWLLNRVGPTRALTVTFLIPVFGALWGWAILAETIHPVQLVGGAVILVGTYLVARREAEPPAVRTVAD